MKTNADWISELPPVITKNNITLHTSTKMTPIHDYKKVKEQEVYSNLQDKRQKQKPECKLGGLVTTSDFRSVFIKRDSTY